MPSIVGMSHSSNCVTWGSTSLQARDPNNCENSKTQAYRDEKTDDNLRLRQETIDGASFVNDAERRLYQRIPNSKSWSQRVARPEYRMCYTNST